MAGMLSPERAQWLHDLPARTALKLANKPRVRVWLGNRHAEALRDHAVRLPTLPSLDAEIVDGLNRDGIYRTSLARLAIPGSEQVIDTATRIAEAFETRARALHAGGQQFIIVPPADIAANPAIFHWGLSERLLDIAEAYIGLPAAFDGVAINYTVADGRQVSTRKWHRDWEDRRMLKVAVYLHDVDDEGGPFEAIANSKAPQSDLHGYTYELADDASLGALLGKGFEKDLVSCTGLRGSVVFCDTARNFHRGKPATARDRKALFYSYFANTPRHPFLCERTGLSREEIRQLAQGLPPRQKSAALWRGNLPQLLRLIPSASL